MSQVTQSHSYNLETFWGETFLIKMNDFFCLREVFFQFSKSVRCNSPSLPPFPPNNEALHVTNTLFNNKLHKYILHIWVSNRDLVSYRAYQSSDSKDTRSYLILKLIPLYDFHNFTFQLFLQKKIPNVPKYICMRRRWFEVWLKQILYLSHAM